MIGVASKSIDITRLPSRVVHETSPNNLIVCTVSVFSGAVLGLSAPGFDQWYLAWVGLVPLILLCSSSKNLKQAFLRGLLFGAGYEMFYLNWIFGLHPLDWLGFNPWQSCLLAFGALFVWAMQQALLVGIFAVFCRLIPMTGSILPEKSGQLWRIPAVMVIPAVWVLWMNKLGNAHFLCGVPWGMLEYSQYKQLFVIQIASIIGGIGIGFLIVAHNALLASLIATYSGSAGFQSLATGCRTKAVMQLGVFIAIVLLAFTLSYRAVCQVNWPANQAVSILQGNVNFNMLLSKQKVINQADIPFLNLISKCSQSLCVGTENALPYDLYAAPQTCKLLADTAKRRKLNIVLGCLHSEENRNFPTTSAPVLPVSNSSRCNSAIAIAADGSALNIYHKRFLVPISEYTPQFFQLLKSAFNLPSQWRVKSLVSGQEPGVFKLSCGSVAPLICVECMSPELAASSVRAGGELLITLGDPSFLHDAMVGRQMIAFNVLRAVENRRFVAFACNTGPSAIIDPAGRIVLQSQHGKVELMSGKVGFNSELTPFCRWFSALVRF
ncbi:MAG: apolipoprotein N-acyltransferase [Candidatus Melainabacteria bacterium]|nr:apolipoprotein N-acyltransferase [Candidatus Melainabacteria bacterium]